MKNMLCDFGLIGLMVAPFLIIPAAVIGFALFLLGDEDLGLWICAGVAAASVDLDPSLFERSSNWKGEFHAPAGVAGGRKAMWPEKWTALMSDTRLRLVNRLKCDCRYFVGFR